MTTVMAFGVFDGLHEGHRAFLRAARTLGDRLLVAVAQDATVRLLKGHAPRFPLGERIAALAAEGLADEVVPGDEDIGAWEIVVRLRPAVIALGYDQEEQRKSLLRRADRFPWHPEIRMLEAHEPERYKSSKIADVRHA